MNDFATREYLKSVNKISLKVQIFIALILTFGGYAMMFWIDWRIAVALFLILWGHNITEKLRKIL